MKFRWNILVGMILVGGLITIAYLRSGLLNLPIIREEITATDAGLLGLDKMRAMDEAVATGRGVEGEDNGVALAALGVASIRKGESEKGIQQLEKAVQTDPTHLVLGNTLRMEMLQLKRQWIAKSADKGEITLAFPDYLHNEPVRFFRELVFAHPTREAKLQLALGLVDQMILFPALEIKAPASVEAVEILTEILQDSEAGHPYYVPALYARGLNYLYRPFNLVWPETLAAPEDAASRDVAVAVAIGRKMSVGSNLLKAELALTLGDAYAKEGKSNLARSWWQIANNMGQDDKLRERVFLRLQWKDDDLRGNLEQTLEGQMGDLDHPLSDLRFMWL
jgi:hypothetical protein